MPDFSMCAATNCKIRARCYRHTATPHPHWQTWFDASKPKGVDIEADCEYYYPNSNVEEPCNDHDSVRM